MDSNNQDEPTGVSQDEPTGVSTTGRTLGIVVIVVAVAAAAGIGIWKYTSSQSDDDAQAAVTETTAAQVVSDSDDDVTELPQNPSLRLLEDQGTLYVENDGNVTMSNVEVRDAAGSAVCAIGTISPGARSACDATNVLRPATAVGNGPQGQEAQSVLE